MIDSNRNRGRIARVLCALSLCCILIVGLWPFGHPRNDVTWVANRHAIRFGKRGTVLSTGPLPSSNTDGCSVEMWLRPSLSDGSSTVLAFYSSAAIEGWSLHQSLTDLRLDNRAARPVVKMYVPDVFRAAQTVFLTIVSGPGGTYVFLNGALARQLPAQKFQSSNSACSGNFVVGDSPRDNDTWEGELSGLAIYLHDLTPEEAMANYSSWATNGHPDEGQSGKPDALYLFDEREGDLIRDHGESSVDLSIPRRYVIAHQILLESPWSAFEPTRGYVEDIAINIGGFVPFGFTLGALLLATGRITRVTAVVVLTGFLVSLMIETLQAYLPTRDSDLTDVMTNTLGTWIGVLLHRRWLPPSLQIFSWMRTARY